MSRNKQIEDAALMEAIAAEKEYVLNDMDTVEFIDTYCKIENKDNPGDPVMRFKLWESQKTAVKEMEENRFNIILKARQLGFTWLCLCMFVFYCIKYDGYRVIVLSEQEDKSKELINRCDFILSQLPNWLIISYAQFKDIEKYQGKGAYKGLYYVKGALSVRIVRAGRVDDTHTAIIQAQPSTEGAGRSLTGDVVFFDEWAFHAFAEDVFTAAFPTIARASSGRFIGLSTNKRGSFYEDMWKNSDKYGCHKIFRDGFADPRRDEAWYEKTAAALQGKMQQEFPRTEEEALIAGSNVSFPEFAEKIHVCKPFEIPKHWRKWASVDNGYNDPFAWYKYAVSEDGIVYIYYEYSRWRSDPQIIYSDQAREFQSSLYYYDDEIGDYGIEDIDYIVAGKDAWNSNHRDQEGKCLIDYYREGGIREIGFVPAVTDRKLRKATLHEYLKPYIDENTGRMTAKLQIFDTCEYLISILPMLVNDDKNPEVVADLSDIDNCLTGDTLIRTSEGLIPIEKLVGTEGELYSYNEETGEVVTENYHDVRCTNENADIYELELENGATVRGTYNHPILTTDGWKALGELTEEDELVIV